MLRAKEVHARILQWVDDQNGASKPRRRKLRRKPIRRAVLNFVIGQMAAAGLLPPAEDAPERDWAAFFEALLEFLEGLAPLIERLIGLFPADAQ